MSNENNGLGYGATDPFQAAGMIKTNSYDMGGNPVSMGTTYTSAPENEIENNTGTEEAAPMQQISEQPQSPAFDLGEKFGGRFKSLDEVETYLMDVESKAAKDPFANDLVRNLNKAIADGIDPELYMNVSRMDVNEMSEKEALILEAQMKNGLSPEDAEFFIERAYKLPEEINEYNANDPDVREAQIKMRIDAQKAKEYLENYKQDALSSPKEKWQAQMTAAWEPVIPKVVENFKNFTVSTKAGDFNVPASEGAINAANTLLSEVIKSGMLDNMPDQEGMAIANAIVEKEILKHDFHYAIDYIANQMKQQQLEQKHNIRKPFTQQAPINAGEQQGVIDFLRSVRG
jgi:hypothetical protein